MKYRPDIDGIRAIAVLLVLFYHAHFSIIASGFIGVDIFFVISGFLITNIIVSEINTTGTFRFINFYKKRLWRLMPVFIVALIMITIMCMIFYLPEDLISFTRSLRSTTRFASNQFFSNIVGGYFSPNADFLPLLHTWSLSIEWQFYAFLPIGLLALIKIFKIKQLPFIIGVLWLSFFILAMYMSKQEPTRSYYFLSTRIFELLTGAFLAVLPFKQSDKATEQNPVITRSLILNGILSAFGIIAFALIAFVVLNKDTLFGFPNYYALIICLATAILIAIGQISPRNIISQILSCKILVGIGLISYSLYMWHWPIFALMRYLSIEETLAATLLALSLSFVFGTISWYFLERPARRFNQTNTTITLIIFIILPIFLAQHISRLTSKYQGIQSRFGTNTLNVTNITRTLKNTLSKGRYTCIDNAKIEMDKICQLGDTKAPIQRALLIGDSFANQYWGFMDVLAKDAHIQVQSNTRTGCLVLPDIYMLNNTSNGYYEECRTSMMRYYERIKNIHYDYVIIGQAWTMHTNSQIVNQLGEESTPELLKIRIEKGLEQAINLIINSGARPVIIEDSFMDPKNGSENQCIYKLIKWRRTSQPEVCDITQASGTNDTYIREILMRLQNKYPSMIWIDPKIGQCLNGICHATIEGVPLYTRDSHLLDFASHKIGERYLALKDNPFKSKVTQKKQIGN